MMLMGLVMVGLIANHRQKNDVADIATARSKHLIGFQRSEQWARHRSLPSRGIGRQLRRRRWIRLAIPNYSFASRDSRPPARAIVGRLSPGTLTNYIFVMIESATYATLHASLNATLNAAAHTTLDLSHYMGR